MDDQRIQELFSRIKIWQKGDERAPHKPLLLLYALGRLQRGQQWLPYAEVKADVGALLQEFGPPRTTSPLYPFRYLESDGFWRYNPSRPEKFLERELARGNISGGFTPEVYQALVRNPVLLRTVTQDLLDKHFPPSLHEDILDAVGLDLELVHEPKQTKDKRTRDPSFRDRILQAYEYRCAVCGFNVMLGTVPVALEAAHIKWHQFGGPDLEENGLALCSLHHKLFDRGAFTLHLQEERYVLRVSKLAHGSGGFEEWLLRYHDQHLRQPQSPDYVPNFEYTNWHVREVFKGTARYSG